MSVTSYGDNQGLIESHDFSLKEDKTGLWTGTQTFHCKKSKVGELVPERGADHPQFTWLKLESVEVTSMKGEWAEIKGNYAGKGTVRALPPGGGSGAVFEGESGIRQVSVEEPLNTNPYWKDEDANEINLATQAGLNPQKNQDGTLKRPDDGSWSNKTVFLYEFLIKGVTSYLRPSVEYFERDVKADLPKDLEEVGKIASPAPTGAPTLGNNRDWLLTGYNVTQRGDVYEVEKVWLLSEDEGWDDKIYEKNAAP